MLKLLSKLSFSYLPSRLNPDPSYSDTDGFCTKGSCGYFIMFGPRAQGLPNGLPLAAGAKADAERGAAACVCARGMVKSGKEPRNAAKRSTQRANK